MNKLPVHIIVAANRYGQIGYKNTIPWKLKGDLKRFKERTMGQILIVGRNTFESMPTLVGRAVIVVSETMHKATLENQSLLEDLRNRCVIDVVCSLEDALVCAQDYKQREHTPELLHQIAKNADRVYVAGGAKLYQEALQKADILEYTLVMGRNTTEYDTRIEDFHVKNWELADQPIKVEDVLVEGAAKVISHIYYIAKRVDPALRKLVPPREDFPLQWVFYQCGYMWIDNAVDVFVDATRDCDIGKAVHQSIMNNPGNEVALNEVLSNAVRELRDNRANISDLGAWVDKVCTDLKMVSFKMPPVIGD